MKSRILVSVLLILILSCSAQRLTGQSGVGSTRSVSILSGKVFDRNGAVVVGSKVSLAGDNGTRVGAVTNDEGIYHVDLPAGFYNLQIRANGFSTFSLECYQVPSDGRVNLDVTLKVNGESGCESGPCKDGHKPNPRAKKQKTIIIE